MKQLDKKRVFQPLRALILTKEQKHYALRLMTTVTKERYGRIKGHTCADGRKQQGYISKNESASPMVSLEALMKIILTVVHEDRQVMTTNIVGAYLNTDMNEFITMNFDEDMVDYMVDANLDLYSKYMEYENGKKAHYVQLLKALYGCIQSAYLWYKMLNEKLLGMGYELNPYDQCIANKDVNGRLCTISYYIDNLIAVHKEGKILEELKDER